MKKIPTNLTDQELLDILNNTKSEPSKLSYKSPYLTFISKYNLTAGTSKVPSKALYELFKLDNDKYSHQKFVSGLKKYLPYNQDLSRNILFLLNKNVLEISSNVEKIILAKKNPQVRKVRNQKRHIEDFLKYFKLKPGNCSISLQVFLDIYDLFCYKERRVKLNDKEFRYLLSIYLPEIHLKKLRYFKVDDSFFEVVPLETVRRITKRNKTKI